MGKKLITVGNYQEHICEDKFFVTNDMILTPGAKDKLRAQGIELVYGNHKNDSDKDISNNESCKCQTLEEKIVEVFVKDFNITDSEVIKKIVSKVKELI